MAVKSTKPKNDLDALFPPLPPEPPKKKWFLFGKPKAEPDELPDLPDLDLPDTKFPKLAASAPKVTRQRKHKSTAVKIKKLNIPKFDRKKMPSIAKHLDTVDRLIKQLHIDNHALSTELASVKRRLDILSTSEAKMELHSAKNEKLARNIQVHTEKFQKMVSSHIAEFSQLNRKIIGAVNTLSTLEHRISSTTNKIASMEAQLNKLNEKIKSIGVIKSKLDELEATAVKTFVID